MSQQKTITLNVNGEARQLTAAPNRTLLDGLRELGYVDVKSGCEKGDCGACAVLLDGKAIDSCLTLAWQAVGREVTTVAGIGDANSPHAIQEAYVETGAVQCGYCTPGMVVATKALLDANPDPSDEEIKAGLSGNLCRCTGYIRIFSAVRLAAANLRATGDAS
jgi:aerobic carbon-monoxide dehydrogenase small subunit